MKIQAPVATVVIPLFNGLPYLVQLLDSLAVQDDTVPFEVILVDNGSTDGSRAVATTYSERLNLCTIECRRGQGQAFARNDGAAVAKSELILFVDQDDVLASSYVAEMVLALETAGIVAARVDTALLNPGWRVRRLAQEDGLAGGPLPWGYGGTLGFRKAVFEQVQGFDESMKWAAEDEDLCWRAQMSGVVLKFAPDALLYYRFPKTNRALRRQGFRYGFAQTRLEHKHRDLAGSTPGILKLLPRGGVETVRSIFNRDPMAKARAQFQLFRRLGLITGKITHFAKPRK